VLEHANTSVLLARAGAADSAARILIPVDGSEPGQRAITRLGELVDLAPCEVTLIHVVETPWIRPVDEQEWGIAEIGDEDDPLDAKTDTEREFVDEAEGYLERARDLLPRRTSVNTLVYHGLPSEQILSELNTGDYDLVVVATGSADDMKHRLLGSVSSKIAWNAPCSAMVIHPGDD
jgi:nucleotide-binding universal stress UspA family protein